MTPCSARVEVDTGWAGARVVSGAGGLGLLMCCCQEELEKTRSNAAGALGNLVRNADLLAPALTELGAVKALMTASDPADGMDSSSKVALYSLGLLPLPTLPLCHGDLDLLLSFNPYAFRRARSPSLFVPAGFACPAKMQRSQN